VDRYIDMRRLKRKYADSWSSLNKSLDKMPASTFRLGTTHLLFEIIGDLISRNEFQTADAILNSTSNPMWQRKSELQQGVESVSQFPPGLSVENREGMFALDHSDDGRFHQCWIIDRVMKKGGFWVGRIADESKQPDLSPKSPGEQIDVTAKPDDKVRPIPSYKGHQHQLLVRSLLSNLASLANNMGDENKPEDSMDPRKFAMLQGDNLAVLAGSVGDVISHKDMKECRSVFDVDGDVSGKCLVFQPFHMLLESIPRPGLRNMSVSWKVERVDNGAAEGTDNNADESVEEEEEEEEGEEFVLKTHGSVKGMWKYNLRIGRRFLLV
jgi:hypothetical protein